LCGEGLNSQKLDIDAYSTKVKCIKLWAFRKSHDDFKFKINSNPLNIEANKSVMYQRGQKNIAICFTFAKVKGLKVNWEKFEKTTYSENKVRCIDMN